MYGVLNFNQIEIRRILSAWKTLYLVCTSALDKNVRHLEDIRLRLKRITAVKQIFLSMLLWSKLLSKKSKERLNRVLPITMYACET